MTSDLYGNKTIVTTLRVRGSGLDSLSTRLRMTSLLGDALLHPSGLPPSAIVFVRKLRDPLPGSLRLEQTSLRPQRAWQQAVSSRLDQLVRSAARPAHDAVPAGAEAVIFLDRSELLACLASDWCDGSAISHWWWRSFFRTTDVTSAVTHEWLTSIEYVPAAFAKLAEKGLAIKFVDALPPDKVSRLLQEITRNFGMTALRASLSRTTGEAKLRASDLTDQSTLSRSKAPKPLPASEVFQLRTRWAPEAFAPRLKIEARLLLVAALMLERAPSMLRVHGFTERLMPLMLAAATMEEIDWPRMIERSQPSVASGIERAQATVASGIERPAATGNSRTRQPSTQPQSVDQGQTSAHAATTTSDHARQSNDRVQRYNASARTRHAKREPVGTAPGKRRIQPESGNGKSVAPPADTSTASAEDRPGNELLATSVRQSECAAVTIEAAIETNLGGIFYLINVALALNLYGDFTRPLDPGIELSMWDFLALIGREMAGKRIEADPIWILLAKLAGRDEGEQPGSRFSAPVEWRMPRDWLDAFPAAGEWGYQTSRDRLIVRHPAGFTVLDVELGSRSRAKGIRARLARETRAYSNTPGFKRHRFKRRAVTAGRQEQGLERWVRFISEYLRARLARAVGTGSASELAAMLFSRSARVEVAPARLNIFFSLAELPVEIRLSGLDRDPGWVPAAGRYIAFHFD